MNRDYAILRAESKKRTKKSEQSLREMCHTIKHTKICIMEELAGEKRKEKNIPRINWKKTFQI